MASFFIYPHQGKEGRYADALIKAGYLRTNHFDDPDLRVAFYDYDLGSSSARSSGLDYLHKHQVPVLIYPHAARPMVQYDGMYGHWPHTRAMIIIAAGHRRVMEAIGYDTQMDECGWALSDILPFKPISVSPDRPIRVLYGPIHPNGNGYLHQVDRAQNSLVFQRLLETPGIQLTVRHIKRMDISGLWPAKGVKYILANPNGSTAEIDQADVVVGHQTFAYLAAARGKPLLMFGDELIPHSGNRPDAMRWAKHYPLYQDMLRYPLEVSMTGSGKKLREQMEQAMSQDMGAQWRKQLIGPVLDPAKFVQTVEKYI